MTSKPAPEVTSIRIDKWLWYARFLKTRSLASKFVEGGKIRRRPETPEEAEATRITKPNQLVYRGDILTFPLGPHIRVVKVVEIGTRRGPAPEARLLYEDLSPPLPKSASSTSPSPQGISAGRRPTKKERRALTRLKDLDGSGHGSDIWEGSAQPTAPEGDPPTMLNRIKSLFSAFDRGESATEGHSFEEHQLAAAALLVEAGCLDGGFEGVEKETVQSLLTGRFSLSQDEVAALMEQAESAQDSSSQLFRFTHAVKDTFTEEERIHLIEMLWEVVYADGVLHDYEANLLRRIGGLIHVSDRDRGDALRRVKQKLGIED